MSAGLASDKPSEAQKRRIAATKQGHGGPKPEPRALPPISTLSATAEAVVFGDMSWLPPDLRWIGPATASPFESLACGTGRRFDAEVLDALGVPSGPLKGEFRLDATGDRAKVELRVYAEGRSSTAWSGDLRLGDPTRFFETDWQDMSLAAEQWLVTDESFVVARNRYCARLAKVTRQGFVELHANAVALELARQGLGVSPELLEVFKRFDGRGGELTLHSRPQVPLNRAAFKALPLAERFAKLEAELSVNGEDTRPFRLSVLSPEEVGAIVGAAPPVPGAVTTTPTGAPPASPSPSTPTVASAVPPPPPQPAPAQTTPAQTPPAQTPPAKAPVPAPSAPPAPAAVPPTAPAATGSPIPTKPPTTVAKATKPPLPSYGRIRYDDLERAIGRTVAVDTRFGTRRVGKVSAFNRAAVTIEINEKGTSLPLTVPRGTVVSVEIVGPSSG